MCVRGGLGGWGNHLHGCPELSPQLGHMVHVIVPLHRRRSLTHGVCSPPKLMPSWGLNVLTHGRQVCI